MISVDGEGRRGGKEGGGGDVRLRLLAAFVSFQEVRIRDIEHVIWHWHTALFLLFRSEKQRNLPESSFPL